MELNLLKELTKNRSNIVTEASKKSESDFIGIVRIIDDACGDLHDKLGKRGSLATLFKTSGAAKLDKFKDSSGKNVMAQIIDLTANYTKAIQKLLVEAEILVNQASMSEDQSDNGLKAKSLLENKGYSDSSDFTEEFYKLMEKAADLKTQLPNIIELKKIMKAPRWLAWMKTTDTNFGTETFGYARSAIDALNRIHDDELESAVKDLKQSLLSVEDELDKAA